MYKILLKVLILFSWGDPERAHNFVVYMMKKRWVVSILRIRYPHVTHKRLAQEVCGVHFSNPVGLAAGFDKAGKVVPAMDAIGFGHVEVGTVVPKSQPGNLRPHIFRLVPEKSLINRMGFNSPGADAVAKNLLKEKRGDSSVRIGISVGKNMDTALSGAVEDHRYVIFRMIDVADYFVVNVSSPNTQGLRDLQSEEYIYHLLTHAKESVEIVALEKGVSEPPLGVKISPDMTPAQIKSVCDAAMKAGVDFIIATNTTIEREDDIVEKYGEISGGLSGDLLFEKAYNVVKEVAKYWQGPIIAVGGISSAAHAIAMLQAGATLLQIYTGFIYKGPDLVHEINEGICAYMIKYNLVNISQFRDKR